MFLDLFTSVDFCWSKLNLIKFSPWILGILPLLLFFFKFWGMFNKYLLSMNYLKGLLNKSFGFLNLFKGLNLILLNLFVLLLVFKLWGLFPYMFGLTTQMMVTLIFSLVLWFLLIFSSLVYAPIMFLSHLTPFSSPLWLASFLKVMELISISIRPFTLSLRLSMNMTTGHIFITLLGVSLCFLLLKKNMLGILILLIFSFYFFFEFAICLIQSFVFVLLLNQYLEEHP